MRRQNSSGSGENLFHALLLLLTVKKKLDNGLILSKFIVARNLFDFSFFIRDFKGSRKLNLFAAHMITIT